MPELVVIRQPEIPTEPKVPKTKEDFCIGCGVCVKVCPKGINILVKKPVLEGVMAVVAVTAQTSDLAEFCIRCRKCVEECPAEARTF